MVDGTRSLHVAAPQEILIQEIARNKTDGYRLAVRGGQWQVVAKATPDAPIVQRALDRLDEAWSRKAVMRAMEATYRESARELGLENPPPLRGKNPRELAIEITGFLGDAKKRQAAAERNNKALERKFTHQPSAGGVSLSNAAPFETKGQVDRIEAANVTFHAAPAGRVFEKPVTTSSIIEGDSKPSARRKADDLEGAQPPQRGSSTDTKNAPIARPADAITTGQKRSDRLSQFKADLEQSERFLDPSQGIPMPTVKGFFSKLVATQIGARLQEALKEKALDEESQRKIKDTKNLELLVLATVNQLGGEKSSTTRPDADQQEAIITNAIDDYIRQLGAQR